MPPPKLSMAGGRFAGDVEAVGIVVDGGVAVGRGAVDDDERAGRDGDPGEVHVVDGQAHGAEADRGVAHGLRDRHRREFGMLGQQCPLVGMVTEGVHCCGQLIAGGVGSGDQQAGHEHA